MDGAGDAGVGAWRGVRRPGAVEPAVGGARRRGRGDLDRQGRGLRVRVLEARRHVRTAHGRLGAAPLRRHRQAGRALRADGRSGRSIRGAAGRDRRRLVRGRRDGRRPRRRPRAVGDAGPGRGGPRVLHGRRGVRLPRRPRGVRGRTGRHRRDVDAVQVPAGAERDGPAGARLPHRAGPARAVRDRPRDAARRADPAVAGRLQGGPRGVRGARHRVASRATSCASSTPGTGPLRRRHRDAVRPVPRRAEAPRARRRRRLGHVRRRLDPGRPGHAGDAVPRRLRGGRRHQRRDAQGRRVRRGPGRRRGRRDHRHRPGRRRADGYDGRGICYLEFGTQGVAVVDVTFVAGQAPFGFLDGPSVELTAAKTAFGTTRVKRWFGQDW